jgi:nicotinamidase-related amidase
MDFQNDVVQRLGSAEAVDNARRALDAARAHDIPVVFVRIGFRDGSPEVSRTNATFARLAATGRLAQDAPATQVVADLEPAKGETVVVKRRVSAFTGSDLEVVLRAAGVDTLVLAGIATSGVVLSTVREAADRDFRLTVLHDACADGDDEVHRVLTQKVFPRQADVVSVQAWSSALA